MAHYGIGELTAVTILAELGDARRFANSRDAVRYAGLDITVYQSDQHRAPGKLSRQGPPALRWALYEAAASRASPAQPRPRLLPTGRRAARRQPRLPCRRAEAPQALLPHAARARRGGAPARMNSPARAKPSLTPMRRGQLPKPCCRHLTVDGLERSSGRNASPSGITPSNIMSPTRNQPRSRTEVSPGARAHTPVPPTRHTHPQTFTARKPPTRGLTAGRRTSKQVSGQRWSSGLGVRSCTGSDELDAPRD